MPWRACQVPFQPYPPSEDDMTPSTFAALAARLADRYGDTPLTTLRPALAAAGVTDRADQDTLIRAATSAGGHYLDMAEGGRGRTAEAVLDAGIRCPATGHLYVTLVRRQEG